MDNLEYIKQGLSTQEQIFEQALAGERFFKKHKIKIYVIIAILVLCGAIYAIKDYIDKDNIRANNILYSKLLAAPNDTKLIDELENANINLFALFAMKNFKDSNETALIDRALAKVQDKELKELLLATKGENSSLLSDYDALLAGFNALNAGQIDQAKVEFSKIPENSNLKEISKNLEHYQGK